MHARWMKMVGGMAVLVAAGFLLGWSVQVPTSWQAVPTDTGTQQVAHLIIDDGAGVLRTFPKEQFFSGQTVFDILKSVTAREGLAFVYDPPGTYGVFIRQIGARKNGEQKKYWQYWVNGEFAMVAADRYTLQSGDTILWKFTGEQQE